MLTLTVDPGAAAGLLLPVTATIDNVTPDTTRHNNTATALTTVTLDPVLADLEVTAAFLPSGLPTQIVDPNNNRVIMRFQVRNVSATPVASARFQAMERTSDDAPALAITGATVSQGDGQGVGRRRACAGR